MDIKELKQVIKNSTAVLVLDNGEPDFVILDYPTYKKMTNPEESSRPQQQNSKPVRQNLDSKEVELMEKINKEILAIKNQIENDEKQNPAVSEAVDF